jgi:hypothetical protein
MTFFFHFFLTSCQYLITGASSNQVCYELRTHSTRSRLWIVRSSLVSAKGLMLILL